MANITNQKAVIKCRQGWGDGYILVKGNNTTVGGPAA